MTDTPFWETAPDDAAPAVTDTPATPARKRATAADLRQAAKRRLQVHERARQALAGTSLPTDAAGAIPWETVARQAMAPTAQAFYAIFRMTQHTAAVLRHAGITIEKQEDLATPEAQLALAQAKADGVTFGPEDPDVLHDLTQQQTNTLMIEFDRNAALRRRAAMALLAEAWTLLRPDNNGNDATITATLEARLAAPGGWEWLAGFPLDIDDLFGDQDGNTSRERTQILGTIPAFTADGYAHIDNSIVPVSARLAFVSPWIGPKTQRPEFRFTSEAGQAIYAPSEKMYPLTEDAWRIVYTLDDAHVDTLDYILAKALANRSTGQRDEYGSFVVTRDEILDARGIHKAKSGGHKAENLAEIVEHVEHLSQLLVRANVIAYPKSSKGKRSRPETLMIEAPLILIPQTLYRTLPDGEKIPIAWHLRPGDWAIEMERFTPQLAIMMHGILKLHAKNDAHAKRIGRYLIYQFRVRAHQKSWDQPYRVETLLAGAGVEIDHANPGRFRQRVEAALDTLQNPVTMGDGPVCIASWIYPDPIPATGKRWLDRWLASGIVIMPSKDLMEERYGRIGRRSRRPHELAS